jgi:hypothetical protein
MPQIRARAALPHRPRISRLSPVSKYTPSWSSCHSNIGPPAYNTACAWSEEIRTEKNVPGAFPVFSTDNAPLEDTQKENIKPRPYMPIQYMPSHTFEASKGAAAAAQANYYVQAKAKADAKAAADMKRLQLEKVNPDELAKKAQAEEMKAKEAAKAAYKRNSEAAILRAAMHAATEERTNGVTRRNAIIRKPIELATAEKLVKEVKAEALKEECLRKRAIAMSQYAAKNLEDELQTERAYNAEQRRSAEEVKRLGDVREFEKALDDNVKGAARETKRVKRVTKSFRFAHDQIQDDRCETPEQVTKPNDSVKPSQSSVQASPSKTSKQATKSTISTAPLPTFRVQTPPSSSKLFSARPIDTDILSQLEKFHEQRLWKDSQASVSEHVELENVSIADQEAEDWEEVEAEDREEWEMVDGT